MRVTSETKHRTRQKLLASARELFAERGYCATSTRELAGAAGVATGTLFNYFASKEVLAMALVGEALERARAGYLGRRSGSEDLVEDLFAHVAAGLRELEPYRSFLAEVLEAALSPFAEPTTAVDGADVRASHLATVREILRRHGCDGAGVVSLHLYWSLYLGVLAFWARDGSPRQQDSLVVLDKSMTLFAGAASGGALDVEIQ